MSGPGAPDVARAALRLLAWMEERDWRGHDPFDLLLSPVAAPLRRLRWPAVAWIQLGRRLPWDPRRLLRVPAHVNPKALALGLQGVLALAQSGHPVGTRPGVLVGRLLAAEAPGGGWGYPFPWANRHFLAPVGTPSSVATAFAAHALLDAAGTGAGGAAARAAAVRGARFCAERLARLPHAGGFLFSYTPLDRRGVHNASVLAASLLARAAASGEGDPTWTELARSAARTTLRSQRPDGSWPYGTSARDGFVDAFHTGYVLSALRRVRDAVGLEGSDDAVARGLAYWRATFLREDGVGSRPARPYPVELHAVAQAILTGLEFRDVWPDGAQEASRLAAWALGHARRPDGAFVYLWSPARVNRIAYLRWVQAWMFRALAELASSGGSSA